jgi:hypothetical protein
MLILCLMVGLSFTAWCSVFEFLTAVFCQTPIWLMALVIPAPHTVVAIGALATFSYR